MLVLRGYFNRTAIWLASSAVAQPFHELRRYPWDLTRLPFFGDLFRQVNFNARLIRNIFFIGQDLELIEHLAGQQKRKWILPELRCQGQISISTRLDLEKSK